MQQYKLTLKTTPPPLVRLGRQRGKRFGLVAWLGWAGLGWAGAGWAGWARLVRSRKVKVKEGQGQGRSRSRKVKEGWLGLGWAGAG